MSDHFLRTAERFGLEATIDHVTTLSRDGATVVLERQRWSDDVEGRHEALCTCQGARLGLDRLVGEYRYEDERPTAEEARNVYEMASLYGERLQQLVPRAAVDVAGAIAEFHPVRRTWVEGSCAELVFIRETRRHFHLLGSDDVEALPYSEENILEYARYALFYDAYKFKPSETEKTDGARFKSFATTNGQAASRATLLPDFDLDAARANGAVFISDRDHFTVAQPDAPHDRGMLAALRTRARVALRDAALPFSRRVYHLDRKRVVAGATVDGRAEFDASRIVDWIADVSRAPLKEATS